MSHSYFCASCSKSIAVPLKCGGCFSSWYCNDKCQKADWPAHKAECKAATKEWLDRTLFGIVAARLGRDTQSYPFEHFQGFMKTRLDASTRTTQEWMEDWFVGLEDGERKHMLRGMFKAAGLPWSVDTYPLYITWSEGQPGNRFKKMSEFIKVMKW